MNAALIKSLVVLVPVSLLLLGSILQWLRERSVTVFLQVSGSACLLLVVLTHICEATHLFPGMRFGDDHSPGHYLDLSCAVLGVVLFPIGYVLQQEANADPEPSSRPAMVAGAVHIRK